MQMDICLSDGVVHMKLTSLKQSVNYVTRKVANNSCNIWLQHAGKKIHKEKATVRCSELGGDSGVSGKVNKEE